MDSTSPAGRLYALELRTERFDELLRWYRSVLSARCLVRVAEDGYALLDLGGLRLALLRRDAPGPPSQRWSLAIETDDLPACAQALEQAGTPFRHLVDAEQIASIECRDPDGNRLRIFCWPAQSA